MSKSTIKPVCMGHGLKRSYFSEKGHSSYMLLSSRSKSIFWKVHQSGQVWLWIQKVMPSGLKEVTLSYKLPLSNRWLAWFLLAGIYLYVRELDVFWAGQLEKPIPSLFSRGVRLQSLLTPISSALSFQCLASIHDSPFTFVGKIRSVRQTIIFLSCRVTPEWCLCPPVTVLLLPHCRRKRFLNVWL